MIRIHSDRVLLAEAGAGAVLAALLGLLLGGSPGCDSAGDSAAASRVEHTRSVVVGRSASTLRGALELWRGGDRDEAVRAYVDAVHSVSDDHELVAFELTEEAYRALPPERQSDVLENWIELSGDLRGLSRAVYDSGEALAAAGDADGRERYLSAIRRVGRAHADSDVALIGRTTGEALLRGLESRGDAP